LVVTSSLNALTDLPSGGIGVNDNTVFFTPWTLQGRMVRAKPNSTLEQGTEREDLLLDGAGNDQMFGLAGSDLFISYAGHDLVDFGPGLDAALYFSPRGNFRISGHEGTLVVQDLRGAEGQDTFFNIERLSFADSSVAFDMDGSAGWVARVLGAVWGPARLTDAALVGKGLRLMDNGMTREALVQMALDHAFGAVRDIPTLVNTLYRNVYDANPTAEVLATYVNGLQTGAYSPAKLGVMAAEAPDNEAHIGLTGLRATGIDYVM
jgi:hypothetical protein